MCESCYEEAGKPVIINDKTIHAATLIQKIYDSVGGGAGGYAHIVVDDWNLNDSSIEFCLQRAIEGEGEKDISEECRQACLSCLNFMKILTLEERHSSMAIQSGFVSIE